MLSTILSSILWFIVAIGVLVTVHEFGHFWVARRLGVKVLRFSIGFGRPLWMWRGRTDDTEYCVGMIPLGGYVKMLDEGESDVAPEEVHRAFNRQSLKVRFAVVSAGPVANFLFAILAYWLMFIAGVGGFKPLVGDVEPGSRAAAAGLAPGQLIVRVDERETRTWQGVVEGILRASLSGESVAVQVEDPNRGARRLEVNLDGIRLDDLTRGQLFGALGVEPSRPRIPAILDEITTGSPGQRAGLQAGDQVREADGQPVRGWQDFVAIVKANPERTIDIALDRAGRQLVIPVTPARVGGTDESAPTFGRIGVSVLPTEVDYEAYRALERYPPGEAFSKALTKTWDMTTLTLQMLWKMVTFEVSVKNLSGPISIAQYAGLSAQVGVARFLNFLAIVSISLGILNFLPIPLLDGGHLMYYCIELLRGRPLSEQAQFAGQRLGVAVLFGLMGLAFYNDLARIFG